MPSAILLQHLGRHNDIQRFQDGIDPTRPLRSPLLWPLPLSPVAADIHPSSGPWLSTRGAGGKKTYGLLLLVAEACGNVVCGVIAPRSLTRPPWAGKCGKRKRAAGWLRGGRTKPVADLLAILRRFLLDTSSCLAMLSSSSGVCTVESNARLASLAW